MNFGDAVPIKELDPLMSIRTTLAFHQNKRSGDFKELVFEWFPFQGKGCYEVLSNISGKFESDGYDSDDFWSATTQYNSIEV